MTIVIGLAISVVVVAVAMMVQVQRREKGFYAHPSGQDVAPGVSPENEAGTHTSFPVKHP